MLWGVSSDRCSFLLNDRENTNKQTALPININIDILSYIGSVSLVTLILLYITSYVFNFCEYHRMFLHYIVSTWIINIIDYYVGIPISDLEYLCLQMIIAGISLFIILYLYVKSHKKSTIKDSRWYWCR